jgi:cell division initiation protein
MKLTPMDIHHKEFRNSIRGYNQEEVDQFLDEVADEFERLFKENIDLSEKLEAAIEKVRSYADMEKTLHNTMLAAQQSAEGITLKAGTEAESLLKDAELKAKELVQGALAEKQKTQAEFMRIKQAEDEFRMAFRNVLERYMRELHAVPVDAEVATLVGLASAPEPEAAAPAPAGRKQAAQAVEQSAEPAESPEAPDTLDSPEAPDTIESPEAPDDEGGSARPRAHAARRGESTQPIEAEPPQSGFVQSLTLGEVEGPDVRPDTPTFEEPGEFAFGGGSASGEREDDLDIEQID